jgi:hypothetical protein
MEKRAADLLKQSAPDTFWGRQLHDFIPLPHQLGRTRAWWIEVCTRLQPLSTTFRQPQCFNGANADLSRVFEAGLADLDYLLGDHFGEGIVPILDTDGA